MLPDVLVSLTVHTQRTLFDSTIWMSQDLSPDQRCGDQQSLTQWDNAYLLKMNVSGSHTSFAGILRVLISLY